MISAVDAVDAGLHVGEHGVPGLDEGGDAVSLKLVGDILTATLAKGISVNVTLIFSLERYEQVIDAFIEGIAQARWTRGRSHSRRLRRPA